MDNLKRKHEDGPQGYLHVEHSRVEEGETYPIFGMITQFLEEKAGEIILELNNSIKAKLFISDSAKILALREKSFETGIFVSKVLETEPELFVECKMVIFGKSQAHYA